MPVAVTLMVSLIPPPPPPPPPSQLSQLSVDPSSLSFSYEIGSGVSAAQSIQVTSNGAPLTFTAKATPSNSRISISPMNGTTPQQLTVTVNPDGLLPRTYTDTITVTPSNGSLPVSMTIIVATRLPTIFWLIVSAIGLGLMAVIGWQQRKIRIFRASLRAEVEAESPILETDSDGAGLVQFEVTIQVTSDLGEQNVIADNSLVREVKEK